STYGTVYCCPGALAGYRASVVRDVLDRWVNQKFFGVACTYGEDRSMTNYILACGYDTVYQRAAVVHTIVPITYVKLCKMFLRWDRSYVREEIRFASIVWKRPPGARFIAIVDAFITNLRYPMGWAMLVLLTALTFWSPIVLPRFLFAIGVMACFNMLYYLRSERSWDFVYGIFYSYYSVFALFWIMPYAACTARARGWLTR
ncbi:MAG: glycosyltransferase family 2 protein, partial [Gammaproteobacteria bacterium]